MVLVCPGCKNKINLDDGTLPVGIFKIRCTSCGRLITAQNKDEPAPPPTAPDPPPVAAQASGTSEKAKPAAGPAPDSAEVSLAVQAFVKEQLSTSKKEILHAMQALFQGKTIGQNESADDHFGSKNALVCSADKAISSAVANALKGMGYQSESCSSAAESLKNVDSTYGIIVIDTVFPDDPDGAKKLIGRINSRKAVDRRKTFLVLISSTQKTLDGNAAFFSGVNMILNKADLDKFQDAVRQSQKDFQRMYSTFRRVFEEKQGI